jgi:hypothetical protein
MHRNTGTQEHRNTLNTIAEKVKPLRYPPAKPRVTLKKLEADAPNFQSKGAPCFLANFPKI